MNPIEFPKIYIGTDIVEVQRINKLSDKLGRKFLDRIFTTSEQNYCDEKATPSIHYSGRFAAKESIVKALKSSGYDMPLVFKNIEILPSQSGAPLVSLKFDISGECKVSISHTDNYATAMAIFILI